mmetsp:Transcript_35109/g.88466  ORF Transcript_35109/g.88466 Transcript_35109/m.88466 type:complete len:226 (+) Transcript_35109:1017-1694(+)
MVMYSSSRSSPKVGCSAAVAALGAEGLGFAGGALKSSRSVSRSGTSQAETALISTRADAGAADFNGKDIFCVDDRRRPTWDGGAASARALSTASPSSESAGGAPSRPPALDTRPGTASSFALWGPAASYSSLARRKRSSPAAAAEVDSSEARSMRARIASCMADADAAASRATSAAVATQMGCLAAMPSGTADSRALRAATSVSAAATSSSAGMDCSTPGRSAAW